MDGSVWVRGSQRYPCTSQTVEPETEHVAGATQVLSEENIYYEWKKNQNLEKLEAEVKKKKEVCFFLEGEKDMIHWCFSVVETNSCSKNNHHTMGLAWGEEPRALPVSCLLLELVMYLNLLLSLLLINM